MHQLGKEHFSVTILASSIDKQILDDLLHQKIIEYISQYTLYNTVKNDVMIHNQHKRETKKKQILAQQSSDIYITKDKDTRTDYSVYEIINLITNKPCLIGKTTDELEAKLTRHCTKSDPLYSLIKQYGKENFKIQIIKENLTKKEAIDLEKQYIRNYANKYELANKKIPSGVNISSKLLPNNWLDKNKNISAVICLNTHTIFNSPADACKATGLDHTLLHHGLYLQQSAGFDENNKPLYWKFLNRTYKEE